MTCVYGGELPDMTNFTALIPEMLDWNNGKGINVKSWVACSFDEKGHFVEVHTSKDTTYVNNLGEIGTSIAGRSRTQVQRVHDEMNRMGKPFDLKLARNVGEVR